MPRWYTYVLLILLLFVLASFPLAKQFEPETGSIQGLISDQLGPLPQASVEARNLATGATLYAESDPAGLYILDNLHPGRYSLWVTARYHDSLWIQQIAVEHGQTVHHDIFLASTARQTFDLDRPTSRLVPSAWR
jgi:hypothetical protein